MGSIARSGAVVAWVLGVLVPAKAQDLGHGIFYAEMCPAYCDTVPGAPGYTVLLDAWGRARAAARRAGVDWREVTTAEARAMGAQIRPLGPGQCRHGRHMIFGAETLAWARARWLAVAPAGRRSGWSPPVGSLLEWVDIEITRERGSTFEARCPWHGPDRDPSVRIRLDPDGHAGVGHCFGCGARLAVRVVDGRIEAARTGSDRSASEAAFAAPVTMSYHRLGRGPAPGTRRQGSSLPVMVSELHPEGRSRGHGLVHRDVGPSLDTRDRRARSPHALKIARDRAAAVAEALPEDRYLIARSYSVPLIAVSEMAHSEWRPAGDGRMIPEHLVPVAQRWVVWDLDDLTLPYSGEDEPADDAGLVAARPRIQAIIDADDALDPSHWRMVRTGPTGVHVWCRLRAPRHDPRGWFSDPRTRHWHAQVGQALVAAIRAGGHSDPSAAAAGRWCRAPGWRILPTGAFRVRLVRAPSSAADSGGSAGPRGTTARPRRQPARPGPGRTSTPPAAGFGRQPPAEA